MHVCMWEAAEALADDYQEYTGGHADYNLLLRLAGKVAPDGHLLAWSEFKMDGYYKCEKPIGIIAVSSHCLSNLYSDMLVVLCSSSIMSFSVLASLTCQ